MMRSGGVRRRSAVFTVTGAMTLFTLMPAAGPRIISRRFVIGFSGVVAGLGAVLGGLIVTPVGFVLGNVVMSLGTGTAGPAPAAYVADIAAGQAQRCAV